jgi:hypothetical protein
MVTMHTINRNLVVVKPIQPLIDWVNNHIEWEQPVTLDQLSRDSTVYLIPEAPNDAKALKYILAHKNYLFAVELNTWNKDPKTWKLPPMYRFVLNPHTDVRFSTCPDCSQRTLLRKVPLVVHVQPHNPMLLNKHCRFCPDSDLLIVHQDELEAMLVQVCQ